MHLKWKEAGAMGTNAIVGGGVPQAAGYAWSARQAGTDAVSVAYLGDGAANIGSTLEAVTYRLFHQNGPFPGSAFRYRSKEEEAAWRERDPVRQIGDQLVRRGLLTRERVEESVAA